MIPRGLFELSRALGRKWFENLEDGADRLRGDTGFITSAAIPFGSPYTYDVYSPFPDLDKTTHRLFRYVSGGRDGSLYRYQMNELPTSKHLLARVKHAIGGLPTITSKLTPKPKAPLGRRPWKRKLTPRNPNYLKK